MSRTLTPEALRMMFSPEADDDLIVLVTITGPGIVTPIRLADNFTQRISETDEDVVYGVVSRSQNFIYLPMQITTPSEVTNESPRASISITNVTRQLIPAIREATSALNVLIELVLKETPNVVEVSFQGLSMGAISYDADTISAELTVPSLAIEPFPSYVFSPSYFGGLF